MEVISLVRVFSSRSHPAICRIQTFQKCGATVPQFFFSFDGRGTSFSRHTDSTYSDLSLHWILLNSFYCSRVAQRQRATDPPMARDMMYQMSSPKMMSHSISISHSRLHSARISGEHPTNSIGHSSRTQRAQGVSISPSHFLPQVSP